MSSVFLVSPDVERYQSLICAMADEDVMRLPLPTGERVLDRWSPPIVVSYDSRLPRPDIWHTSLMLLAATEAVVDRLEPFFATSVELLPLRSGVPGLERLFALNVINRVRASDAIDLSVGEDERETTLRSYADELPADEYAALMEDASRGFAWPVLYPAFVPDRIPRASTLFVLDQLPTSVFLVDHEEDDDTLLRRLTELEITGLVLTKVWASDIGGEPINLFRP